MESDTIQGETGYRSMISALGLAQICSWGSLFYSFPLMAEAMRSDLGWSKPELYGAATVGLAMAGLAAYPVGAAIDRGRGRLVMCGASVAAGLALIAWSRVEGIVAFYVVFALIGGLQAATLYEPAFAVITRRVGTANARRGITAVTLWGGFASTVFIPLIQLLVEAFGWRGALVCLGAVNVFLCGTLHWLAIDPSKDVGPAPPHAGTPVTGRRAVAQAVQRPVFWALVAALVAYAAAFSTLTFHLYPMLLERGLTAASVVIVMAVIGPAQVAGRVVIWAFAPQAPVRLVGSIIVIIFPLAVLGFAYAPPEIAILAIVAGFYGAANGMMTIVRGLAVPEMVSPEAYGSINGALVAPTHFVQAVAPLAAASIWAASGGYELVMLAIFAASMVLAVSFWIAAALARPRELRDPDL